MSKWILVVFISLVSIQRVDAQKVSLVKKDNWHGFVRQTFDFEGREAWIVEPTKQLQGKAWIWKAYFPDWHTDIDSILLSRGFHLAYLQTNDMFGSALAMQWWNLFHKWMTGNGFAERVALEGISRGGLYVYNWAKRNPLKVSCIYAEAPVCDVKSWPGGKGKSKGSPLDWQLLQQHLNFSESQVMEYADNPVDGLEGLAACNVPVLHSIGLNDKIVPNDENSFVLADRYVKLGGIVTLMPMTRSQQQLEGHHFVIEHPERIADFIYSNSYPVQQMLPSANFHVQRSGLQNSYHRFAKEKVGRVAFMGGSITEGKGWREYVCQYLQQRFPDTKFEFINAGISSTGSTPGAFRLQQDVLSKGQIDLFFEEAAVNDRTNGFNNQAQVRGMEGIIRHMRIANPMADVILMHCVDPDKMKEYRQRVIPAEIQNHERVAEAYGVNTIHLAREVTSRIDAGEFSWERDFKDLHPSPFGHHIYSNSIRSFLEKAYDSIETIKPVAHVLPRMIDPDSYGGGQYVAVDQATFIKGWRIEPNWMPKDGAGTRKQYVNIPALIAEQAGETITFSFKGSAVGICIASGPDAGRIQYSIDGGPVKTLELFTQWSGGLHLPWYLILDDHLKNKKHQLTITIAEDAHEKSKGHACRILHFLVNQ